MLNSVNNSSFNKISKSKQKDKKKSVLSSNKSFVKGILDKDPDEYKEVPYNKEDFEFELDGESV